jgi:hypothetical protein
MRKPPLRYLSRSEVDDTVLVSMVREKNSFVTQMLGNTVQNEHEAKSVYDSGEKSSTFK